MAGMEPQNAWNVAADAWREFVRSGADYYRIEVHGPALLAACGEVGTLNVLDLGCGEGFFSRLLARNGAHVTALDVSAKQLLSAREQESREPLGIEYVHLDAREIATRFPAHFDLVTACMSLQDIPDAASVCKGAASVLRSAGRLVFSVPHPCTDTPVREWERDEQGRKLMLKIDRYFDAGESVMHWNMPRLKYHWSSPFWRYTLQQWSDILFDAGFLVRRLNEPRPTPEQVQANPNLEDCARVPYFLVVEAERS